MAENYIPNPVATFVNDTTAVNVVNGNFTAISTALSDCLSLSGTAPNQMKSNLDMNSSQIINLPPPGTMNSPARLVDVASNPTITVPPTGTSGGVVGFLNGNNTVSGNNTYTGTSTFTNTVTLPANSVTRANLTQGAAKSVIGVTGNATANVADIVPTNTRQVLTVSGPGTGTSLIFAQPQGDQLLGTTTNDNAATGNVGEVITATTGTFSVPVALTTATAIALGSISLTAGDWDVWYQVGFTGGSTTTVTSLAAQTSTTSASVGQSDVSFINIVNPTALVLFNSSFNSVAYCGPIKRYSLASTTSVFLNVYATFATSTCSGFGNLFARRVR
jgi:hypothetical protein